jgi:anti-sigma B factor antagonist
MPTNLRPRLLAEPVDGVTVVTIQDSALISENVIRDIDQQLLALVGGESAPRIVVNFCNVRLMSSGVLAVLIKLAQNVARAGGRLRLCSVAPDLMGVFKITRLDGFLGVTADEAAALDCFSSDLVRGGPVLQTSP